MDGPPAQSLGVEPVEEGVLRAKPRKASDPIVTQSLLLRAISSALLIMYLTLKTFSNELEDGKVSRRDTTMTFMTFVNCDLFNAYACRSSHLCFYEMGFTTNKAFLWAVGGSIIGQMAVIYFPPLQSIFQTEALSIQDLLYIIAMSSTVLMLDTLRKKFCSAWCSDAQFRRAGRRGRRGWKDRLARKPTKKPSRAAVSSGAADSDEDNGGTNSRSSSLRRKGARARGRSKTSRPVVH
jgi:magnesium-transporting ATPase (P-type)